MPRFLLTHFRVLFGYMDSRVKTKDQTLGALKKWYCDIAPIRPKHKLITLMRDNADENRSQEVEDFIQSIHVQSRYSAPYEQWQDGQPETAIRTLTRLVRSMKNESCMGVRFWYHMLVAAANASNVTYKKRINTTPHRAAHGEKKNLSMLYPFGCRSASKTLPKKIPRGVSCPDCMIGKCQRQDLPSARIERAKYPLEQVNWDLMMVNEVSNDSPSRDTVMP